MQTFDFIEFVPDFGQFELAHRATSAHAKHSNAPEERVHFILPTKFDFAKDFQPAALPSAELSQNRYCCCYESYKFPETTGDESVFLLHITGPEIDFYYSPVYQVFLNRRQVIGLQ
jgi:hypothetical protein